MESEIREIIKNSLFENNFRIKYAGDLSNFLKQINDKLEIKIK